MEDPTSSENGRTVVVSVVGGALVDILTNK